MSDYAGWIFLAVVVAMLALWGMWRVQQPPQAVKGSPVEPVWRALKHGGAWDNPWVARGLFRRDGEQVRRPEILSAGPRGIEFAPLPGTASDWLERRTVADLQQLTGRTVRVSQTAKGIAVQV